MENASKALLIAGAILICILLIAIGMYIYNSANATIKSAASQMSQQEKDIYNAKVKPYVGDTIKGSEVISMIETVISMNQENATQTGKFISISASLTKNGAVPSNLDAACNNCNYYTGNGENDEANVAEATSQMTKLKSKINSSKRYSVTTTESEGLIHSITIVESGASQNGGGGTGGGGTGGGGSGD